MKLNHEIKLNQIEWNAISPCTTLIEHMFKTRVGEGASLRVMQGPWNRLIYTSSTALTISLAHTSLGKILSQKLPAQNFLAQKISCPKTSPPKTFMPNTKHGMEQVDPNEQHQRPPSSLPLFRLPPRCIQTKVDAVRCKVASFS